MAKLIYKDKEIELKDGDSLTDTCEQLGVPFSCYGGTCGTCTIKILEGQENLSSPTEAEMDMGMVTDKRLACQCKIKKGKVKIDF